MSNQSQSAQTPSNQQNKQGVVMNQAIDQWADVMSIPLDENVVSVMAQLAIPNNVLPTSEEDLKAYEAIEARQQKLADFCLANSIQLFPFPERIALISKLGMRERLVNDGQHIEKQIPKLLLTCWNVLSGMYPVEIVTGKEVRKENVISIKGSPWDLESASVTNFSMAGYQSQLLSQTVETTPWSEEDHKEIPSVFVHEMGTWMLAWAGYQMRNLSPAQLAELSIILQPGLEIRTNEEKHTGLYVSQTNNECFINLSTRDVVLARGQDRLGMKMCAVYGFALPILPMMTILAVKIGSKRFNGSVAGEINDLPNMWLRDANYGHSWEADHPTRAIVDDYRLPIGAWVRDEKRNALSVWPFVILKNEKHDPHLAARIKQTEGMATTDKYNMKSVGGKKATLARGIWMNEGEWKSLHDAGKAAKMQNRPDQARKFQCLYGQVVDAEGNLIADREASAFYTLLDE